MTHETTRQDCQSNLLFDLPEKEKKRRKPFVRSQRWICKRCAGSVNDHFGCYCHRFDLCIEFEKNGDAILCKNGCELSCDGKEWSY